MSIKTFYVRPEDEHVFKKASAMAKEEGESLSSVIVEALRRYITRKNTTSGEGLFAVVDLYDNSIEIFKGEEPDPIGIIKFDNISIVGENRKKPGT